jgi:hypothetical protein
MDKAVKQNKLVRDYNPGLLFHLPWIQNGGATYIYLGVDEQSDPDSLLMFNVEHGRYVSWIWSAPIDESDIILYDSGLINEEH